MINDSIEKKRASTLERVNKVRAKQRDISYPPPKNLARRRRLEKSLAKWLKYYMADAFPLDWAGFHIEAIDKLQTGLEQGLSFALALPRGSGKSTLCRGAILWAIMSGLRRYILLVGATAKKGENALKDIKSVLRFNARLREDYPEIIEPFIQLEGVSLRTQTQTANGEPTNITWTAKRICFPTSERINGHGKLFKNPSSGAVIDVDGITGDIRGHVLTLATGEVIRPDAAIVDDPQTRESAKSPEQVRDRLKTITDDIAGSSGPGESLSVLVPCTIIDRDDLADKLLNKELYPDFRGQRLGMFISFPKNMEMWENDYNRARVKGVDSVDGGAACAEFYKSNREKLDEGAVVSWEARKNENEVSAIQSAMNSYLKMGKAGFYAEYQNDPINERSTIYDLTQDTVSSKVNGMQSKELPVDATTIVGFIDINHYGLHWSVMGLRNDFAGFVPIYGRYPEKGGLVPKNSTDNEKARLIHDGLVKLCDMLSKMSLRYENGNTAKISLLLVDRGYMPKTVHAFAKFARYQFRVVPSRGYAGHVYKVHSSTLVGRAQEQCHTVQSKDGQFVAFNSCYWKEFAQKAWFGNVGSPGAFSLYGDNSLLHSEFADHICSEVLTDIAYGDRGPVYRWSEIPGRWHDWGDCIYGCAVAAAISGLRTTGETKSIFEGRRPRPVRRSAV